MIVVKNREMLIPKAEYNIGTNTDSSSENRIFQIDRVSSSGVDLANLTYRIDLQYSADRPITGSNKDTVVPSVEITDNYILLTWNITQSQLEVAGSVLAQISAFDESNMVRWSSFIGAFFVEDAINTPGTYTGDLSAVNQFIAEIETVKTISADEATRKANETIRVSNEKARNIAENFRETHENTREEWFNQAKSTYKDAITAKNQLEEAITQNPGSTVVDPTFSISGAAAESKAVGKLRDDLNKYADIFTGDVDESVKNWLKVHPEATTTVEDGSLTLPKFKEGELPFVTPEQFGAKGDGITDDTTAWQSAVDSGYNVRATKKNYKCGQIDVTNNIDIDCNGADFICTSSKLFNCGGALIKTLTNESNYVARQKDYEISERYTGYGMIKGVNNELPTREYYRAGMVGFFEDGVFKDVCPTVITSPTVDIIEPITCIIKNISNILFANDIGTAIYCKYGVGCLFKDIHIDNMVDIVIELYQSYNCTCENVVATPPTYVGSDPNPYIILINGSCYCNVVRCILSNNNWHCITTGGNYYCISNVIKDCICSTESSYAIADHDNGLCTKVIDTTTSGLIIGANGYVNNVIITESSECSILVGTTPIRALANCAITHVHFMQKTHSAYIYIRGIAQTSNNIGFISNLVIDDVTSEGDTATNSAIEFYRLNPNFTTIYVFNVKISNTGFAINFNDGENWDYTNAVLMLNNLSKDVFIADIKDPKILLPPHGEVRMNNVNLFGFAYANTYPNIIYISNAYIFMDCDLKCRTIAIGNNLFLERNIILTDANRATITNVNRKFQSTTYSVVWKIEATGNAYAKQIKTDGTEEIMQLT